MPSQRAWGSDYLHQDSSCGSWVFWIRAFLWRVKCDLTGRNSSWTSAGASIPGSVPSPSGAPYSVSLFGMCESKLLSRVRLFATPWTVACQTPPSMGFSRQECWSGLPLPSPTFENYVIILILLLTSWLL